MSDPQATQTTQHEDVTAALGAKERDTAATEEDLKNKTERLAREQAHLDGERQTVRE